MDILRAAFSPRKVTHVATWLLGLGGPASSFPPPVRRHAKLTTNFCPSCVRTSLLDLVAAQIGY